MEGTVVKISHHPRLGLLCTALYLGENITVNSLPQATVNPLSPLHSVQIVVTVNYLGIGYGVASLAQAYD